MGSEYSKMTWKDAVIYLDGKERGWLLFLDNADSLDLDLRPYLPRSTRGTILITTRNRECVKYAPDGAVHVGGLEESEAVNLLHTVADFTPASDSESLKIVRELGMHPLAITQAGVYIRKTRRLDTYFDTFRTHRDQLLRKQPDRSTEYTSSTYTAFDLSYRQLPAQTQGLMKLFACLYPSLIPVALFEKSTESCFTAYTVRNSCPLLDGDDASIASLVETLGGKWNQIVFQETMDSASRASLINISTDGLYYSIHPLVQTYIKDDLGEVETQRYIRTTALLLLGATRPLEEGNSWYWQLLPHVNGIPRSIQSENIAHALAFRHLYDSLGDWKPCRELLESALSQLVATRGQRDEDSIWLMGSLATTLRECGHPDEAEKMQREVLTLRLYILGGRHSDTVQAMNNLAMTLRDRDQLDEAEKVQQEVLALWLDILGVRHPDTIQAMSDLAHTLYDRGQLNEAEKMEREVLALRLDIIGRRHPETITAMNNLALTLSDCGQLDEAEKMHREVLGLRLVILGGRHPDTVQAMNNLAITLRRHGQLDEAEKMQREVLALWLEVPGGRHPDTITATSNLASTLRARGQLDEAEKMQREVLALRLEILGRRHPDIITAMNNLATTLHNRGQLEAEKMKREVLALRLAILGGRHPGTIRAMNNLATTLLLRGQLDAAEKLQREALGLQQGILGQRHPNTPPTLRNLSVTP